MKLGAYLLKHNITAAEFGRKIGKKHPYIPRLLDASDTLEPSLRAAIEIEDITEGEVTCRDLLKENRAKK